MSNISQHTSSRSVLVTEGPLRNFKIHYHDVGAGETIVMMHGSGPGASGWSNFHRNINPMVEAGYRVLLIDSPGWSDSDPIVVEDGPRSVYNAAAVKGVLNSIGVTKTHLIGNSMGGAGALQLALDHPDLVDRIVVMGSGGAGHSLFSPMPMEGIKLISALYREPTAENLKRMMSVFVYNAQSLTDELIQGRLQGMLEHREHLKNFVRSGELNPKHLTVDLTSRLPQLRSKTLITWGRDDRFMPMDLGLKLLWGLPNAEFHIFSRCGHWAQWEHADRFNEIVLSFLSS